MSENKIVRKNGEPPLYQQLKDSLMHKLSEMSSLSPIPSERELCETFGVSRPTVRRALKELEQEGKLYRLPGKGTFIADKYANEEKYVDHELQWFIGFHEDASMQRKNPSTKVLQQIVVPASGDIAQKLNIAENSEVFVLERLRFVDNEPICVVTSYIPLRICPEIIREDFTEQSLFGYLRKHDIRIHRAKRSIEVKHATLSEATYLGVLKDDPVMLFQSLGYTKEGVPFEFVKSRYPAFKARFESEVFQPEEA